MGCSFGLKTPYEECAFLLREYQFILRKRKNYIYTKNENDKKKLDKSAKSYKEKIYENLDQINKSLKTDLEVSKLQYLNSLFQALLTEESEIYKNKKDEKNDKDENEKEKDIPLIDNSNDDSNDSDKNKDKDN